MTSTPVHHQHNDSTQQSSHRDTQQSNAAPIRATSDSDQPSKLFNHTHASRSDGPPKADKPDTRG
jgi:hypothetical protein